jgi:multidrug efflux system membrane fusion protein
MKPPTMEPRPSALPTVREKKRNRRAVLFGILVILVCGTAALLYFRSKTAHNAAFRPGGAGFGGGRGGRGGFPFGAGTMPVVVKPAASGSIDVVLKGLGTVTPMATVTVRTQISGQLVQVNFKEDQTVNKGDLLAVIDPRPYEVALEQAEGQLTQAQAQLKEAQIDLERYKTLATQDSISKQQVDAQQALVLQYEGMENTNQAAVDSAKLNLVYCHITAPVAGRVGLRLVDQGNYVTPGDANGLVILAQEQPITVIFTLPEDDIPSVVKQVRAGKTIPVDAYNRDSTVKLASGKLMTIDNTVDPTTGTFKLRAVYPNADESLFPNQFVNASMLLDVQRNSTIIPTSAVERGQQGSFVYVVAPDAKDPKVFKASARNVTLGTVEGENVAVTGVKAGESIVIDGADRLKDGMVVDPQQAGAPAGAAKASGWAGRGPGDSSAGGDGQHWRHRKADDDSSGSAKGDGSKSDGTKADSSKTDASK